MRRRDVWLVAALALLLFAAWLLTRGEDASAVLRRREKLDGLDFPRYHRPPEIARMLQRQTLPAPPRPADAGSPERPHRDETAGRDPLLSAMAGPAEVALVLEVGAFRDLPMGRMLFECLVKRSGADLAQAEEKLGMDLDALDRIAMLKPPGQEPMMLVTGRFDRERLSRALGERGAPAPHGRDGTLFGTTSADGGGDGQHVAMWSDGLLMLADSATPLKAAIERVERATAVDSPAIPPDMTYGELYGRVQASLLAGVLPEELGSAVRRAARDVELHVDATDDALIVADVSGDAIDPMTELGRAFGGALSAARLGARAQGATDLVELLDLARVSPSGDGSFRVEAALPLALVRKQLGECAGEPPAATP